MHIDKFIDGHLSGTYLHKTCFAGTGEECNALTETLCLTQGKCSFYKTQEQFLADKEKANKRNQNESTHTAISISNNPPHSIEYSGILKKFNKGGFIDGDFN